MYDIRLTGISIGYENNLIYECSRPEVMEEFKSYLDSSEVKRLDMVLLWFSSGNGNIFLVAEPISERNVEWVIKSENLPGLILRHEEGRNLLDEIQDLVRNTLVRSEL